MYKDGHRIEVLNVSGLITEASDKFWVLIVRRGGDKVPGIPVAGAVVRLMNFQRTVDIQVTGKNGLVEFDRKALNLISVDDRITIVVNESIIHSFGCHNRRVYNDDMQIVYIQPNKAHKKWVVSSMPE